MDFKDKVVLITGATGGMGEALAIQVASQGASLALFARRKQQLQQIAKKTGLEKNRCIFQTCDVTKLQDVQNAISHTISRFAPRMREIPTI